MIEYVVENTTGESVTVDGLGVLLPWSIDVVGPERVQMFEHVRGLKLTQAHMPGGIELHVRVFDDADTVEGE
jgi:hypothetical protein